MTLKEYFQFLDEYWEIFGPIPEDETIIIMDNVLF